MRGGNGLGYGFNGVGSNLKCQPIGRAKLGPSVASWWIKKVVLILNVPRQVGHSKRSIISAAFSDHCEVGSQLNRYPSEFDLYATVEPLMCEPRATKIVRILPIDLFAP